MLLRGRHIALCCLDRRQRIAEQLRVDAEYERGIDGLARAADLGRELVQRVEVLQDVVKRALGDVLPFILSISVVSEGVGDGTGRDGDY